MRVRPALETTPEGFILKTERRNSATDNVAAEEFFCREKFEKSMRFPEGEAVSPKESAENFFLISGMSDGGGGGQSLPFFFLETFIKTKELAGMCKNWFPAGEGESDNAGETRRPNHFIISLYRFTKCFDISFFLFLY